MKKITQLLLAVFVLFFACISVSSCYDDVYGNAEDNLLTDEMHGSLTNRHVVATGEVKNVTNTSATIYFSANYNYKKSLGIKPGIRISTSKSDLEGNHWYDSTDEFADFTAAIDFTSSELELNFDNLKPSTKYYYCAVADAGGYYHYGDIKSFRTPIDYSIYEAVDLGLSVKWANMNIGATLPESSGDSFYWGETETSTSMDWHEFTLSTLNNRGYIDANNNLCPTYDAATQIWGNGWRMPTKDEWQELIDKCGWKEVKKGEYTVYLITGPNSNFIYLPMVDCWSSTASTSWSYCYEKNGSYNEIRQSPRSYHLHIRPVRK